MYEGANALKFHCEGVIREHAENVGQLLALLSRSPFQLQRLQYVIGLCHRCEANIDALRIAGDKAISILQPASDKDDEVAGVVALLLVDCTNERRGMLDEVWSLLRHKSPGICKSTWWGLRFARSEHLGVLAQSLTGNPAWDFGAAAALDVLAFHRLPVEGIATEVSDGVTDEAAWLLTEARGRIPGAWSVASLRQSLAHPFAPVREAGLRASARSGLTELAALCRDAASQPDASAVEAIDFLGVVGSAKDLEVLQRCALNRETVSAAMGGLGRLGSPVAVPFLLQSLAIPDLSEPAAAALERITGQPVSRSAHPAPPLGMTEEDLDLWVPDVPIDVERVCKWWSANACRFDPAKCWQSGLCVSDNPLGPVFDELPMAIRYDVYLRQRALIPGTPDWELETWPWRQRHPGAHRGRAASSAVPR